MGLTIKDGQQPKRNEPCPCDSGLKFKHCHGDPKKTTIVNQFANQLMFELIMEEKYKKGMIDEEEYKAYPDIGVIRPMSVEDIQKETGLNRCTECGTPISKPAIMCVKCGRKEYEC